MEEPHLPTDCDPNMSKCADGNDLQTGIASKETHRLSESANSDDGFEQDSHNPNLAERKKPSDHANEVEYVLPLDEDRCIRTDNETKCTDDKGTVDETDNKTDVSSPSVDGQMLATATVQISADPGYGSHTELEHGPMVCLPKTNESNVQSECYLLGEDVQIFSDDRLTSDHPSSNGQISEAELTDAVPSSQGISVATKDLADSSTRSTNAVESVVKADISGCSDKQDRNHALDGDGGCKKETQADLVSAAQSVEEPKLTLSSVMKKKTVRVYDLTTDENEVSIAASSKVEGRNEDFKKPLVRVYDTANEDDFQCDIDALDMNSPSDTVTVTIKFCSAMKSIVLETCETSRDDDDTESDTGSHVDNTTDTGAVAGDDSCVGDDSCQRLQISKGPDDIEEDGSRQGDVETAKQYSHISPEREMAESHHGDESQEIPLEEQELIGNSINCLTQEICTSSSISRHLTTTENTHGNQKSESVLKAEENIEANLDSETDEGASSRSGCLNQRNFDSGKFGEAEQADNDAEITSTGAISHRVLSVENIDTSAFDKENSIVHKSNTSCGSTGKGSSETISHENLDVVADLVLECPQIVGNGTVESIEDSNVDKSCQRTEAGKDTGLSSVTSDIGLEAHDQLKDRDMPLVDELYCSKQVRATDSKSCSALTDAITDDLNKAFTKPETSDHTGVGNECKNQSPTQNTTYEERELPDSFDQADTESSTCEQEGVGKDDNVLQDDTTNQCYRVDEGTNASADNGTYGVTLEDIDGDDSNECPNDPEGGDSSFETCHDELASETLSVVELESGTDSDSSLDPLSESHDYQVDEIDSSDEMPATSRKVSLAVSVTSQIDLLERISKLDTIYTVETDDSDIDLSDSGEGDCQDLDQATQARKGKCSSDGNEDTADTVEKAYGGDATTLPVLETQELTTHLHKTEKHNEEVTGRHGIEADCEPDTESKTGKAADEDNCDKSCENQNNAKPRRSLGAETVSDFGSELSDTEEQYYCVSPEALPTIADSIQHCDSSYAACPELLSPNKDLDGEVWSVPEINDSEGRDSPRTAREVITSRTSPANTAMFHSSVILSDDETFESLTEEQLSDRYFAASDFSSSSSSSSMEVENPSDFESALEEEFWQISHGSTSDTDSFSSLSTDTVDSSGSLEHSGSNGFESVEEHIGTEDAGGSSEFVKQEEETEPNASGSGNIEFRKGGSERTESSDGTFTQGINSEALESSNVENNADRQTGHCVTVISLGDGDANGGLSTISVVPVMPADIASSGLEPKKDNTNTEFEGAEQTEPCVTVISLVDGEPTGTNSTVSVVPVTARAVESPMVNPPLDSSNTGEERATKEKALPSCRHSPCRKSSKQSFKMKFDKPKRSPMPKKTFEFRPVKALKYKFVRIELPESPRKMTMSKQDIEKYTNICKGKQKMLSRLQGESRGLKLSVKKKLGNFSLFDTIQPNCRDVSENVLGEGFVFLDPADGIQIPMYPTRRFAQEKNAKRFRGISGVINNAYKMSRIVLPKLALPSDTSSQILHACNRLATQCSSPALPYPSKEFQYGEMPDDESAGADNTSTCSSDIIEMLDAAKDMLNCSRFDEAEKNYLTVYQQIQEKAEDNGNLLVETLTGLADICIRRSRMCRSNPLEWQWLCMHAIALLQYTVEFCDSELENELDNQQTEWFQDQKQTAETKCRPLEDAFNRALYNCLKHDGNFYDPFQSFSLPNTPVSQTRKTNLFPLSSTMPQYLVVPGMRYRVTDQGLQKQSADDSTVSVDWLAKFQDYCKDRLQTKDSKEVTEKILKSNSSKTDDETESINSDCCSNGSLDWDHGDLQGIEEVNEDLLDDSSPVKEYSFAFELASSDSDNDNAGWDFFLNKRRSCTFQSVIQVEPRSDDEDEKSDATYTKEDEKRQSLESVTVREHGLHRREKEIISPLHEHSISLTLSRSYCRLADKLVQEEEYRKAEAVYEKIIDIIEDLQDGTAGMLKFSARIMKNLGTVKSKQGKSSSGLVFLNKALQTYRDLQDEEANFEIAIALIELGNGYIVGKNNEDTVFDDVIVAICEFFEKDSSDEQQVSSTSSNGSGSQMTSSLRSEIEGSHVDEAVTCYTEAINLLDKYEANKQQIDMFAKAVMRLGDCYFIQKEYDQALDCYEKSLGMFRANNILGKDSLMENAHVMCMLGVCSFMLHVYPRAASVFEMALHMVKCAYGFTRTFLNGMLLSLSGITYYKMKNYHKCVSMCYQAYETYKDIFGEEMTRLGKQKLWLICQTLYVIGNSYNILNLPQKAMKYLSIGRSLLKSSRCRERRQYMRVLQILGDSYFAQYDYKTALQFYNEALEYGECESQMSFDEVFDPSASSDDMTIHNHLVSKSAEAHISMQQYQNAVHYLEQAHDIQAVMGEDIKEDLITTLNQLGEMHSMAGDVDKAIESYRESLEVFRELHDGELGPEVCPTLGNLAAICYVKACVSENLDDEVNMILSAEQYFQDAMKLDINPGVCVKYANFLYSQGHYDDAILYLEDALKTDVPTGHIVYGGLEKVTLPDLLQDEVDAQEEICLPITCLSRYLLLLCFKCLGQNRNAEENLIVLLEEVIDFDIPLLHSLLGYAMMEMELFEEAAQCFLNAAFDEEEYVLAAENYCICIIIMMYRTLQAAFENIWLYYGMGRRAILPY